MELFEQIRLRRARRRDNPGLGAKARRPSPDGARSTGERDAPIPKNPSTGTATNLPLSEWTTMFPNARLCKAMLDRLTDQAHIIETGNESPPSAPVQFDHVFRPEEAIPPPSF